MKKYAFLFLMIGILLMPSSARADFFNGDDAFLKPQGWEAFSEDSQNRASFLDQNGRLEWITAPGWHDEYDARRYYISLWAFDLTEDFSFNLHMHLSSSGNGGLVYGLVENRSQGDPFWQGMMNWGSMDAAWFCEYNAETDQFMTTIESGVGSFSTLVSDLKTDYGMNQLKVFLGGYSYGESFYSGDVYFWNFAVTQGTMTPEPASLWLMGMGLIFFAVRRDNLIS